MPRPISNLWIWLYRLVAALASVFVGFATWAVLFGMSMAGASSGLMLAFMLTVGLALGLAGPICVVGACVGLAPFMFERSSGGGLAIFLVSLAGGAGMVVRALLTQWRAARSARAPA